MLYFYHFFIGKTYSIDNYELKTFLTGLITIGKRKSNS